MLYPIWNTFLCIFIYAIFYFLKENWLVFALIMTVFTVITKNMLCVSVFLLCSENINTKKYCVFLSAVAHHAAGCALSLSIRVCRGRPHFGSALMILRSDCPQASYGARLSPANSFVRFGLGFRGVWCRLLPQLCTPEDIYCSTWLNQSHENHQDWPLFAAPSALFSWSFTGSCLTSAGLPLSPCLRS